MHQRLLLRAALILTAAAAASCDKTHPTGSTPPPTFAIHDGEARPACTHVLTRTDMVAPQTVAVADWGPPQKVGSAINTDCPEDDPEISGDGQTLYFYGSPIPKPGSAETLTGTSGVYRAQRIGDPGEFGTPTFMDLRKGTTGAGDGHPRLTAAGDRLYFHSIRADNTGYRQPVPVDDPLDVYRALLTGGVAGPAENLGTTVNSVYKDGEPEIAPDGVTLYFASNRPGGLGANDLYTSVYSGGTWSAPVGIGAPINTADDETQVAFAEGDPSTLYFTSNRGGMGSAIYRSHRSGSTWGTPELVIQGQVGSPSLTADGSILYFVHVQTDGTPGDPVFGADLYNVLHR